MYQVLYCSEEGTYLVTRNGIECELSFAPTNGFATLEDARATRALFLSDQIYELCQSDQIKDESCIILNVGNADIDSPFPFGGEHTYEICLDSGAVPASLRVYKGFHYHITTYADNTDVSPMLDLLLPQAHFCTVLDEDSGEWFAFNWKNVCFNIQDRPCQITAMSEKEMAIGMIRRSFSFGMKDIQFTSDGVSFTPVSNDQGLPAKICGTRHEVVICELVLSVNKRKTTNYLIWIPSRNAFFPTKRVYKDVYYLDKFIQIPDGSSHDGFLHLLLWNCLCQSFLTGYGAELSEKENETFLNIVDLETRKWSELAAYLGLSIPTVTTFSKPEEPVCHPSIQDPIPFTKKKNPR